MTPMQISALLAVYCRPDDMLAGAAAGSLVQNKLIEPVDSGSFFREPAKVTALIKGGHLNNRSPRFEASLFRLTPRGMAYVRALMDLPLPQAQTKWRIPNTELRYEEHELL